MAKRPVNLDVFADEVRAGLPHEGKRLDEAQENQAFYDLEPDRYMPRRDAESEFDHEARPKRFSGFTRECIDVLTDHLYNPGPSRHVDGSDEAAKFLDQVYEQNQINSLLQEADALSTLNDACAIQVDPGDGDFADRPLDLILWGGEEFVVWTDPNNSKRPIAVCTIDRHDAHTRYRLWNEVEVRTYVSQKTLPGQTSGGVAARQLGPPQPHDFGCIPFAFVHYKLPTRYFWTSGPGTFLRKAELRMDDRLSKLDESIEKHMNPIPVAEGVGPEFNPVIEPMRFVRLPAGGTAFSGIAGDYSAGMAAPRLYFISGTVDVAGSWEDLLNYINQALQAAHVPLTAVRMEQNGFTSGIQILAEQAPLLTRAKKRHVPYTHYETELAKLMLLVAGNHYRRPDLAAAAKVISLSLCWPEPRIPIPGPDRNNDDDWRLEKGLTTRTRILMEREGLTKEQAVEQLRQLAEERTVEAQIEAEHGPEPEPAPGDGEELEQEDGNGSPDEGEGLGDEDPNAAADGESRLYGDSKESL